MKPAPRLPLLLLSLLAACSSDTTATRQVGPPVEEVPFDGTLQGTPDPIANPSAKKGGSLVSWAGGYPKSLNCYLDYNSFSIRISGLMFEALLDMDSVKDEPLGILASSWEISPDKTTFTFKIRPEATWSDGKPVTAEDVQFFYDVIMNPKNLTSLFRVDMSRFDRPEILDSHTIRLRAKDAHWKNFWSAGNFYAFPKHAWEGKDFNEINFDFPVVSGPYEIHEIKTNRSISLKRRANWWGRCLAQNAHKYNFDYLVFKALEDQNKALDMLKRGDIDLLPIYTARIWAQQTKFPQTEKNWVVRQTVYNQEPKAFQGLAINMRRDTFKEKKVRLALAHLFNREMMLEKIMFNEYFLLNSYYPDLYPGNRNPNAPLVAYDPEKARTLLKEAGWKVNDQGIQVDAQGRPFELVLLYHGEIVPQLNIYLEDLKAVGIQARIDVVSQATFTKRVDQHDFDLIWRNWAASRLRDPESMWSSKTANEVATQNISAVQDAQIDALIEEQKLELDLGKRNELLKKIDNRLVDIMPYVLMWQSDRNRLLYWNRFGTPVSVLDKFNREEAALPYWWFDAEKSARLDEALKLGNAMPAEKETVRYEE